MMMDANIENQKWVCLRTPNGHPDKPGLLCELGHSYNGRFIQSRNILDLDRAISAYDNAVELTPSGHPSMAPFLSNLGNAFASRFEHLGAVADIRNAISAHENAVRVIPTGHPKKPSFLSNLGGTYDKCFKRLGHIIDSDKAISAYETAARLTPEAHRQKPIYLSAQGSSYTARFMRFGDVADIDRAISTHEAAVALVPEGHSKRSDCLSNLGNSYATRFECTGDIADFNRAIASHEAAVQLLPDIHPKHPSCLSNMGGSYLVRFELLGDDVDIHKAISAHEKAVRLTRDGRPNKSSMLSNLGHSYNKRFQRFGDIVDIDKAISAHENAVRLVVSGHPNEGGYFSNLGTSYGDRFDRLGDITDLNKALAAHENAVRLTPKGHPNTPGRLSALGNSFSRRFERLGNIADINRAISNYETAVRLTPNDHRGKPGRLSNLGTSYGLRFKRSLNIGDINEAVSLFEDAIRLTPDTSPKKPHRISNQANSLTDRCSQFGDIGDIDKAISLYGDAVRLIPESDPFRVSLLTSMGSSILTRFELLGDVADIDEAIRYFIDAARSDTGPPFARFTASLRWARCAREKDVSPLEAYSVALELLPRVAWLGLAVSERHRELADIGAVVRDAAATAVAQKQYATAVEWLEQGRSIVWRQVLNLRSPVDRLRAANASLADKLEQVSNDLENAASRESSGYDDEMSSKAIAQKHRRLAGSNDEMSSEAIAQKHRRLASEWEQLVGQIRTLEGFEDFMQPKKLSQLRKAAQHGPVVIINVHRVRCDALVVEADSDQVIHIPLNSFSYDRAEGLQRSIGIILSKPGLRARSSDSVRTFWTVSSQLREQVVKPVLDHLSLPLGVIQSKSGLGAWSSDRDMIRIRHGNNENPDEMFRAILSQLWEHVVKPVLDRLSLPISQTVDPPRMWWCATGPLAFLPLHAAGVYENDEPGSRIWDFVTSSYTPTLSALLEALRPSSYDKFKLLAVAQPATGSLSIPKTKEELVRIRSRAANLSVKSLEDSAATVERVVEGMKMCSWVHLACHGKQDADQPTKSGLLLHQNRLLELSQIMRTPLPQADFAFLSACQTATGVKRLSEEAVHLAAGMLLAGYRGVIATTWSIQDNDAPFVADEVYSHLFKNQQPDRKRAAHALHHAVQKLRKEKGVPFSSWVPFIHVGI